MTAWTNDRLNRLVTQQAGSLLRVAGTVNEPARVTVQGQPATVEASGVFVGGVQVAPGTTRFTVTATDTSGNVATQSYDVDQVGPTKTFTFDANGNLTSDGTRQYVWDADNRLVEVKEGSTTIASFGHKGEGLRTTKSAAGLLTTYLLAAGSVVEERLSTGAVTSHVQGPGHGRRSGDCDCRGRFLLRS